MNKTKAIRYILGCAVGALSIHYMRKSSYTRGYLKGQADAFEEVTEDLRSLDEWMEANIRLQEKMREQSKKN